MKGKFVFLVLSLLLIPALCHAGTAYYVNPKASGGGNGSYAKPWNTITQVNNHQFSKGDDVYFKAATTISLSAGQRLNINWDGSKNDPVVVGAYYGQNQFGLGGNARPIISGLKSGVRKGGILHTGAVRYRKTNALGYIHVKDLHVTGVIGYGVELNGGSGIGGAGSSIEYCRVENVKTTNTGSMGIGLYHTFHSMVLNCIVENSNQDTTNYSSGCGIEIGAVDREGNSKYNTVRGCTVARGYEGIGIYKGPLYTTIENNTVYDCQSYHIYVSRSRNATIRNNLIYGTPRSRGGAHGGGGIVFDHEGHRLNVPAIQLGDNSVYGNYVASLDTGILIINNAANRGVYHKNNKIYDNRIVDCSKNIRIGDDDASWYNNSINKNYSFIFSSGYFHVANTSPQGVSWYQNYFNTDIVDVKGNASTGAIFNKVSLKNVINWRNLPPGKVSLSYFDFAGEKSSITLQPPRNVILVN